MTLRPIRAEDADLLDRIIRDDDEIARLTGSVHRSDEHPIGLPIERLREIYGGWANSQDRLVLGVVDNANSELVGEIILNEWDEGQPVVRLPHADWRGRPRPGARHRGHPANR